MAINVAKEVATLRHMTVSELRDRYNAVFGEYTNRDGHVHDYAEIALLGHVTRARMMQIMNLRLLSPCIQEQLLSLSRIFNGREWLSLRDFQSIALEHDWRRQQTRWASLTTRYQQKCRP